MDLPSDQTIRGLLKSTVNASKISKGVQRRITSERSEERLFLSPYSQASVELLVVLDRLEGLLASETSEALGAPCLNIATENSLSIAWGPPADDFSPRAEDGMNRYELQMAQQLPASSLMGPFRSIFRGAALSFTVEELCPNRTFSFRVRSLDALADRGSEEEEDWSPTANFDTLDGPAFQFDNNPCYLGASIFLSADGLQATYGSNESWKTLLGDQPFSCGRNSWEIRIESSATAYLFVGAATREADLNTFLGGDDFGWGYIGDRALYHKRTKLKVYGERFGEGDVMGVCLDLTRGTLSFSKNGLDLGVAFEGLGVINTALYPAIAFYNQGQQVSLVTSSFKCPGAGAFIADSPVSVGTSEARVLAHVLGCIKSRARLPSHLLEAAFEEYVAWGKRRALRYPTREGFELLFDTSPEALKSVMWQSEGEACLSWSRMVTPRGLGTVIGVANGQLWVHVDGEAGAWLFSDGDIKEGRALGFFVPSDDAGPLPKLLEDDAVEDGALESTGAQESKEEMRVQQESKESSEREAPRPERRVMGALEDFKACVDCPRWNAQADAALVRAVNEWCDKQPESAAKTPWNISPGEAWPLAAAAELRLRRLLGPSWRDASAEHLCRATLARLVFLRRVNHLIDRCLPLIGLGDGLQLSSRPSRQASRWGEAPKSLGLAVGPPLSTWSNEPDPDRKFSNGAGFGLGPLTAALRGIVFSSTKKRVLRASVVRTMTKAKKAEDEYDYPEALPIVMLNRPKAAAGRNRRDPETRLSLSLFGQLFDELHFLEPATMRLGYTHPMDDGQERTFKVKFEGEGVDDYGGPYREIFSQIAGEVQSIEQVLKTESNATRRNAKQCILPLLRPSPNCAFEDAPGNDKVVVAPGQTSNSFLEAYNFLGQVIGMAIRSKVFINFNLPSVFWKGLVGEPLEGLEDLRAFDQAAANMAQHVDQLARDRATDKIDETELAAALSGLDWSTKHSGGTDPIELGGSKGPAQAVTPDEAKEWAEELTWTRLHEADTALFAIRDGLASMVPASVLALLSGGDLEVAVCGRYEVDLDILKKNTEYDDDLPVDGETVQRFWRVLESFEHDERSAFLRFVWARSRLPATAADFVQKFKIQAAVGEGPKQSPDAWLPKAHTCFFSLNLPRYTTDEVMAKQLKYAMYNCIEMDADFRLADNEMTGWDEADEKDAPI
mmetsp:Transcript_30833/g.69223  ORF Transcript_30833/g.69223 Transcript_30833/m.69223 type:complete len:1182 (-) Transcript_30833:197-3742(-)